MCQKAESQNGRFCTLIYEMYTVTFCHQTAQYSCKTLSQTDEHVAHTWSAYSLVPRPSPHVREGLECIRDFLYYCPGPPQGWGRNCETNALSIPAVVPRRGRWGISLIGALCIRCLFYTGITAVYSWAEFYCLCGMLIFT